MRLRNVDSYDGDINTIWNVYSATGNRSKIGSHEWGTQGYYKVTTIRGSNYPVMNFNDQFYYLDVTIKRDSVSDTPVFSGVSICGTAVRDR